MAKKKISQLQIDTSLNFEDLLLGTKSEKYNYKISADELLKYLKDKSLLSKLDMGKDVLFNNTTTNVFQSILQTYKVDTLTFDNYGQIKSFSEKKPENVPTDIKVFDFYSGPIATAQQSKIGYFDGTTLLVASDHNRISDKKVFYSSSTGNFSNNTNWSVLFNKVYNFKTTNIIYRHSRYDNSGSLENQSIYYIFIEWFGENNSILKGTGIIRINSGVNGTMSFIYQPQKIKNNTDIVISNLPTIENKNVQYTPEQAKKMVINIDTVNKKINKLPISPYVPSSNKETHNLAMSIENYA